MGLLEHNKSDEKYIIRLNDKLRAFCGEYDISLNNIESLHTKDTDINIENIEIQIELLKNNKCDIRRTAANKLGDIGDDRAIKPLITALKDQNVFVRINAIKSLGNIGDEKAIKPLYELSNEKNSQLKKTALLAIEQIESKVNTGY